MSKAIAGLGLVLLLLGCTKQAELTVEQKVIATGLSGARKTLAKAGLHDIDAKFSNVVAQKSNGSMWLVYGTIESGGNTEKISLAVLTDPFFICDSVSIVDESHTWDVFENEDPKGGMQHKDITELLLHRSEQQ